MNVVVFTPNYRQCQRITRLTGFDLVCALDETSRCASLFGQYRRTVQCCSTSQGRCPTLRTDEDTNLHPTAMAFKRTVKCPLAPGALMCCWLSTNADSVNGSVCSITGSTAPPLAMAIECCDGGREAKSQRCVTQTLPKAKHLWACRVCKGSAGINELDNEFQMRFDQVLMARNQS